MYTFRELSPDKTADDFRRADDMLYAIYPEHEDSLYMNYEETNNFHVVAAKTHDDEVIGVGVLLGEIKWISEIVVAANHRRQKIGSQILGMLEAAAVLDGLDTVKLYIPTSYSKANSFFEEHGYESDGLRNDEFFKALKIPVGNC